MKKNLIGNIIGTLSVSILIVSATIAFNTTLIIEQIINNTLSGSLEIFTNHIQLLDNLLLITEDNLKTKAKNEIELISAPIRHLLDTNTLSDQNLQELVKEIEADEIYIVDKNRTIEHTTYLPDKGLTLTFNPEFADFIQKIYGKGKVFTHRSTTATNTGELNAYFYYSPENSNYIIETSYNLKKYLSRHYSQNFYDTTFNVFTPTTDRSIITDIDIVSFTTQKAWSILHQGVERSDLDYKIIAETPRHGSYTEKKGKEHILYTNTGSTLEHTLFKDTIFIIITYRSDIIHSTITRIAILTACIAFITLILSFAFFKNLLTKKIIDRILMIAEEIKSLPQFEFTKRLEISGNDELNEIVASINAMSVEILDREKQLLNLENYQKAIIDSISSLIVVIDKEDRITLINKAACNLFNLDIQSALQSDVYSSMPFMENYSSELELLKKEGKEFHHKARNLITELSVSSLSFISMQHEKNDNIIIKIDDISEIAKKDEQLLQAQKMEVIGTLAGGFAHNLNNVLSGVIGPVSLLKHKLKTYQGHDRDFFDETVSIISNSAEKAVDISKELLSISRKKTSQFGPVSLHECIENVIKMCNHIFDTNVKITYTNTTDRSTILGSNSQIEHLLLNILVNAYHSMTIMQENADRQGGNVTIILSQALDDSFLHKSVENQKRGYFEISVADTGVGIPENIQNQIFDPFFSTKSSKGTGLGLATVNSIIQQHEGAITFTSKPRNGTIFFLYFPQNSETSKNQKPSKNKMKKNTLKTGTGTILIIDDEPFVLKTAQTILENAGYSILTASNGYDGLSSYKANKVDLVILDMIMPGMSGKETLEELLKIDPAVKTVVSSGFINDDILEDVKKLGIFGYIKKPYSALKLAELVYEVTSKSK